MKFLRRQYRKVLLTLLHIAFLERTGKNPQFMDCSYRRIVVPPPPLAFEPLHAAPPGVDDAAMALIL